MYHTTLTTQCKTTTEFNSHGFDFVTLGNSQNPLSAPLKPQKQTALKAK